MKSGVPLDEMLINYQKHKDKTEGQRKERMKGWEDLKYKHDIRYTSTDEYHLNKSFSDEYVLHNREEVPYDNPYWDTKENEAYYSMNKWQRLKYSINQKVNINKDFIYFNIFLMLTLTYYANKKSKQIIL